MKPEPAGAASTAAEFDEYAATYPQALDHICRRLVAPRGDYFIRLKCDELTGLAARLGWNSAGMTTVDVGCGTGDFERILAGRLGRLIPFDLSLHMLRAAREQRLPDLFCGDACSIPLPDGVADLVFASCLLHHMPEARMAPTMREMRRICKAGGYVVVFEHNPLNPFTQLVVRTTPLDHSAVLFPSKTVRTALHEAGLQVAAERFVLFAPEFIDRRLGRLKRWLSATPLGGQYMLVSQKRDDRVHPSHR